MEAESENLATKKCGAKKNSAKKFAPYSLKKPCVNCPFRTDVKPYLRRERAKEIVIALDRGEFHCHETIVDVEGEDGEEALGSGPDTKHCAGALIMLEHSESSSQMMRISEQLGLYDPSKLDMTSPVFKRTQEFIDAQEGYTDEEHNETCSISGGGCEWPAGSMHGGAVVEGDSPPFELGVCEACGESVCDSCFAEDGNLCTDCAEQDEEG